jgi:hypothetical protein
MDDDDKCHSPGDPLVVWSPSASKKELMQQISMPLPELGGLLINYYIPQLEVPSSDDKEFEILHSFTNAGHMTLFVVDGTATRIPVEESRQNVVCSHGSGLVGNKGRGNQWFSVHLARTTTLFDRDSVWVVTQTMVSMGSSLQLLGDRRWLCLDFKVYPGFWGRLSMLWHGGKRSSYGTCIPLSG